MPDSFGARLRERREQQHVALATIAEQTKIKLTLLEALERDDLSHWPSGIFRRAYVRAYAHAIGLSPDEVVREFLEAHPEPDDADRDIAIAAEADRSRSVGAPHSRLRYMVDSAIESFSRRRRSHSIEDVVAAVAASEPVVSESVSEIECANDEPADLPEPGAIADPPTVNEPEAPGEAIQLTLSPAEDAASNPVPAGPDLMAVASLCTEFGRVEDADDVQRLLEEAARLVDAAGLIIWVWDASSEELTPALAYGYSQKVLSQLPGVPLHADNATAAAFRSEQTCAISGNEHATGALVVPLLTPAGCSGVLALELREGGEQATATRAIATILAALLAQLIGDRAADRAYPARPFAPADRMTVPVRVNVRSDGSVRLPVRPSGGARARASGARSLRTGV